MRAEILVTGGNGLLGYAVRQLCPQAVFPTRAECDLTDARQVQSLFEKFRPRKVLHLAAVVGGVRRNANENADMFAANVQINNNVLSAAQKNGISRLISILSTCALAMHADRPSSEDDMHKDMPFEGNLGYGYAKRMLDIQTQLLWQQYGCHFSTVLPVTMYGPNDNWDLEQGHVISALIHKCFLAKQQATPLFVWGNGKAVRQFVFSQDIARLLMDELERFEDAGTLIAAADEGLTIGELAHCVARVMDFHGPIVFEKDKPEGQLIKTVRSKKFSARYRDFVFTPLERGLRLAVDWFEAKQTVGKS